jgi:hypothetical protein
MLYDVIVLEKQHDVRAVNSLHNFRQLLKVCEQHGLCIISDASASLHRRCNIETNWKRCNHEPMQGAMCPHKCRTYMSACVFQLSGPFVVESSLSIVALSLIMPTTMQTVMVVSNDNITNWKPSMQLVDGKQYIKLDIKDRSFFRFCTGKALAFGSKYENTKYILDFWVYLVAARSSASQKAFELMQEELKQNADEINGNEDLEGPKKRRRIRTRRARMDDAFTVGQSIYVNVAHEGNEAEMRMLFGVKKLDLWVEALPANLDFIAAALKHDFEEGNWATVRPRGPHFRVNAGGDNDDEGDAADDDDDA